MTEPVEKFKDRPIGGDFEEPTVRKDASIGQTFYQCAQMQSHPDGSFAQQKWYTWIYLGTDKVVIKIKFDFRLLIDNKTQPDYHSFDILELPLNDKKQALFDPTHIILESEKLFIFNLVDEWGRVSITAKKKESSGFWLPRNLDLLPDVEIPTT
jgi:hypothetical protein